MGHTAPLSTVAPVEAQGARLRYVVPVEEARHAHRILYRALLSGGTYASNSVLVGILRYACGPVHGGGWRAALGVAPDATAEGDGLAGENGNATESR